MADLSRRAFMRLIAGGGLSFAFEPKRSDRLVEYVTAPTGTDPSAWTMYATTCRECPAGCGMRLLHRDGRVTKAEGSPGHPLSQGALCPRGQSSVQGLYDPDRIRGPVKGQGATGSADWRGVVEAVASRLKAGAGLAVLSGLETGAMADLLRSFTAAFGGRVLFYEPFAYTPIKAACASLFGVPVVPRFDLEGCDCILSFGADFLESWISNVEYAKRFARARSARDGRTGHFAYAGPRLSMTAANADEFLQVPASQLGATAMVVLGEMLRNNLGRGDLDGVRRAMGNFDFVSLSVPAAVRERAQGIARTFATAERGVALPGPTGASGPEAEELATAVMLLNMAAGNLGKAVDPARPHALSAVATEEETARFLASVGLEDVLLIINSNPAYSRGDAAGAVRRAGLSVCLAVMLDETAALANYVLPVDSPLEAWGEYAPYPDITGLVQPTMARLHDTRHAGDIILAVAEAAGRPLSQASSFEEYIKGRWDASGLDWRQALRNGWVAAPAAGGKPAAAAAGSVRLPRGEEGRGVELWAWAPVLLHDGRVANRGWLQEVPEPVSSLSWMSWVDLHPDLARGLEVERGGLVELATNSGTVQVPARITAEVAPNVAALAFGQGHESLGGNAAGRGSNAFRLLGEPGGGPFGTVRLRKVRGYRDLIRANDTSNQHGRELLRWTRKEQAGQTDPVTLPLESGYDPARDLYGPHEHREHRWAMAIDLDRCIGCGACAVACYAENNIPVRGPEGVATGRDQPWLKVVPYFEGKGPRLGWLPMLCQHCDAAPCEPVCPVYAAVHNEEGLNAQIYNRCVGTRYCSNNCPYKVRRFNWVNTDWEKPLELQLNPEVTVRCRGVMEKCTFCVQRIRAAEYRARVEGRKLRDGEVTPACVQTCPADVFTFGDLLDPGSRVSGIIAVDPRRYQLLHDLNTKPAVVYLKRVIRGGVS